jgi:ribosomal protein S18 acetylase RimI-like enzyme
VYEWEQDDFAGAGGCVSQEISIRELNTADLPSVVAIHRAAFPESAFTLLGEEAVRRYYLWLMEGPHDAVALGAFRAGDLAGFCYAGVYRGALSGYLRENRRFLMTRLMVRPWLISNPIFRARLLTGVRVFKRFSRPSPSAEPPPQPEVRSFGILSIAVHPERQGLGVGKRLMEEAERRARRDNFPQMHLSVHMDNQQAVSFYDRLGWERILVEGEWAGKMRKPLY